MQLSILLILLVLFHAPMHSSAGKPPEKRNHWYVQVHSTFIPSRLYNAIDSPNERCNGKSKPKMNEKFAQLNHWAKLWIWR
jgi:hypothetical protein